MPAIETLYVANHSHTDIGFTDYQDVCFRQHREFVAAALDLVEATAERPEGSRYRWVCEVTGPLVRWLRSAPPAHLERFRHWHREGAVDVAAMQYNLTPLLSVEQLCRSLYPVRGCATCTASSALGDAVRRERRLLALRRPARRDRRPVPDDGGQRGARAGAEAVSGRLPLGGPGGAQLLAWNGFHYLFGRSIAKLGDPRFVDRALPPLLERLAARRLPVRLPVLPVDAPDAGRQRPAGPAHGRLRPRLERGGPLAADRVHDTRRVRRLLRARARRPAADLARRLARLVVRRRRLERFRDRRQPPDARAAGRRRASSAWVGANGATAAPTRRGSTPCTST